METYTISQARRRWGALLREAQRNEVPFMLRMRNDPACVGAPPGWYKRACEGGGPALTEGFTGHDQQRLKLHEMARDVLQGAFVRVPRMEGVACVLVPVTWYNERVEATGPPAGAPAQGGTERP